MGNLGKRGNLRNLGNLENLWNPVHRARNLGNLGNSGLVLGGKQIYMYVDIDAYKNVLLTTVFILRGLHPT